ncbi:MAG TPA: GSU2403 family nucleotidyltransferase fold protein, partial [Longimicrobium sp.]
AGSFARLVGALRPWLAQRVVVGGWAHRLHRLHELAGSPSYAPLLTRDADVAFSENTRFTGDIREALRAARFQEEFFGDHMPPVTHYRLGAEAGGFYAEFLVPLRGGGVRRDGSIDATLKKAGITAQKLRHLELLLVRPWIIRLPPWGDVPLDPPAEVMIANPVSFIAQKLLIRPGRSPEKQAQDTLYIHDTLDLFGQRLDSLRELWHGSIRPELPPRTLRAVTDSASAHFSAVDGVIIGAARMAADRTLQADRVQKLCAYGLAEIFGPG